MQIKKILVPTELNEISEMATEYAVSLAGQLNVGEVVLLNLIIPAHHQAFYAAGQPLDAKGQLTDHLNMVIMQKHEDLIKKQANQYATSKVKITPQVRFSNSMSNLNTYMDEFGAGLIVCGSYDKFSFLEILFGSPTEKMVRKVDYPMIVLTEEPVSDEIKNIALAVDVDQPIHEEINEIIFLAQHLHAHLQLVHVIDNDGVKAANAIDKLQQLAKSRNISDYSINVLNNESVENGLNSFVRKFNPDIIAILSQGKGKLHKLIYGSETEEVIRELKIPVFVCKSE